jgi:hypothetical protein
MAISEIERMLTVTGPSCLALPSLAGSIAHAKVIIQTDTVTHDSSSTTHKPAGFKG